MNNVTQTGDKARKTYPLSGKEVAEREQTLRRDLAELEDQRARLADKELRLSEVKEEIKLTELGQEQEALKADIKELQNGIDYLAANTETLMREVLDKCTIEVQVSLPGAEAARAQSAPKTSAVERTAPLPGLDGEDKKPAVPPIDKAKKKPPAKKTKEAPAPTATAHRKAKAEGPLPCPSIPAKGHPQRVLRGWIYDRLCQAGELTFAELCAEAKGYHPEYLGGTTSLLEACELVGPWKGGLTAFENETGRTVDERVQDVVCAMLADEALDAKAIAAAMKTPFAIVWDVLEELREAGRIEKRGELWRQTQVVGEGAAQ